MNKSADEVTNAESDDILVDVHRSLSEADRHFTNRIYQILRNVWHRLPNLQAVTLELNLPPDQLNENVKLLREIIDKIRSEQEKKE